MKSFKTIKRLLISSILILSVIIGVNSGIAESVKVFNRVGVPQGLNIDSAGNIGLLDGLAISKGDVPGITYVHKFGNAPDFDTSDGVVTIWDGADDISVDQMEYVYSTTADIDSISSSELGDTQELKIQGLNALWELTTQTKTLQGQTKVTLDIPLIRVFRMKNNNSTDNAGHIYCYVDTTISVGVPTDSTKIRSVIEPGNNQTLMAIYTIPLGKTGYMRVWYGAIAGASKSSNYIVELRAREFGKVFQLKHLSALSDVGTSYIQHVYIDPEKFAAKVDIEMRVSLTAVGVSEASFSAGFDLVLVDD